MKNVLLWIGALFLLLVGWNMLTSNSSSGSITPEQEAQTLWEETEGDNQEESPKKFGDYTCTSDCSGHEAGYEWAEANDVCDEDFDGGNSVSFAEGVRAWAEDGCGVVPEDVEYDW